MPSPSASAWSVLGTVGQLSGVSGIVSPSLSGAPACAVPTVTVVLAVAVLPASSDAATLTVNVPGGPNACGTSAPVPVPPSPKGHENLTDGDHESDAVAWNVIGWPTTALPPGDTLTGGGAGGSPAKGAAHTVAGSSLK